MARFLLAQLRHRRARLLASSAGILVASVSFVLLTSAVASSRLDVRGAVSKNFRPAYDILVRPTGSFTRLEQQRGLVRTNYLSGIFGGISFADYRKIRALRDVEVAAPIANIGYVTPFEFTPVIINRYLSRDPVQLYRLSVRWDANHGLSSYPDSDHYVYYTRRNPLVIRREISGLPREVLPNGHEAPVCTGWVKSEPLDASSPFDVRAGSTLGCFSELSPKISYSSTDFGSFRKGAVGSVFVTTFPVQIAAIDPSEEASLLDIGDTIVRGRMLTPSDRPRVRERSKTGSWRVVPVIAADRTYVAESADVTIERLPAGSPSLVVKRLSSNRRAHTYLTKLHGNAVGRVHVQAQTIYQNLLETLEQPVKDLEITYDGFWTAGETRYSERSPDHFVARTHPRQLGLYDFHYYGAGWAPTENLDKHFRRLGFYQGSTRFIGGVLGTPALKIVGEFDPTKLPGFSPLSRVPLETYYPPRVSPAGATSRRALDGHDLLPTQNIGGYIAQPPLILTTLQGLRAFTNSTFFRPIDPDGATFDQDAPLAAIRVRVANVTGPDDLSRKRIETVARAIHDATGLDVDVTAGSSPHPLTVELPAGKFGQPPLTVREDWVRKGVAVRFLRAVDRKSLGLFLLVLVACALFLANSSFAAVRARRSEIGALLCLGWSRRSVFMGILGELALVGIVAGLAGVGVSLVLVKILDFPITLLRVALVVPIALLLAVASGFLPALRASRGTPLDAVRPQVRAGSRVGRARGLAGVSIANLRRVPSRTLVGASGVFAGVGALTILGAIQQEFQGTLVGTLLGNAISVQVRGVDLLAVGLVLALGGLSIADVLFLNISERRAELVTLRTLGWRDRDVAVVIALEGIGMGTLGAGAGAIVGLALSEVALSGISWQAGLTGAGFAVLAGVTAAAVAATAPASRIASLTPPGILAEE